MLKNHFTVFFVCWFIFGCSPSNDDDNDVIPNVKLSKSSIHISEAEETIIITATLDVKSGSDIIVQLEYSGYVEINQDFTAPLEIIIPAGSLEKTINFTSIDNSILNLRKKILTRVVGVTNGKLYDANSFNQYVYILDDEIDPLIGVWSVHEAYINGEIDSSYDPNTITGACRRNNNREISVFQSNLSHDYLIELGGIIHYYYYLGSENRCALDFFSYRGYRNLYSNNQYVDVDENRTLKYYKNSMGEFLEQLPTNNSNTRLIFKKQ